MFIRETCARQGIAREQLTIHADRGAAMTSKSVAHAHAITINIRGDSYRLKDKLKAGLVKPVEATT
jgi:DNA replication protein DnaC